MEPLQFMPPVNKQIIDSKLFKLQESVKLLRDYKDTPLTEFIADKTINSAVMFHLVIGIELIIDIGMHILVESFQMQAKNYADVIKLLGEQSVIPPEFAKEHEEMPKFRNFLIHDYVKIDLNEVFGHLQKAPEVFQQFADYYITFLEQH